MAFKILSQPTSEPVSLDEAKLHLRLDTDEEDALVSALIKAARETVERMTGRSTTTRYCSQTFGEFGDGLELQYPPVVSVSGVTYYDGSGTVATLSASGYQVTGDALPPVVSLAPGASWPTVQDDRALPIAVTYTAGYGTSGSDCPEAMRLAIKLLVGHWYRNREAVAASNMAALPMAVQSLLIPLRAMGAES